MGSGRATSTGTKLSVSLAQEAARLGFAEELVTSLVRSGFIRPERTPDGAVRFSFQDLVLLRNAQSLAADKVPVTKIKKALKKLQGNLPEGRPLSAVALVAEGSDVVVRAAGAKWSASSGQGVLEFTPSRTAIRVEQETAPVPEAKVHRLPFTPKAPPKPLTDVTAIFEEACAIEESQPDLAMDRYRFVLHRAPDHADAHVNLGRLLQMRGLSQEAERHYRTALALSPKDATAAFNLGTSLEDQSRWEDAIVAYAQAVAIDPHCADAHYNLACLYEKTGRKAQAIRHLISARAARPQ